MATPLLLTVDQAAGIVGISPQAIVQAIQDKRLPAERFGRVWMIARKDARKFKRDREEKQKLAAQATRLRERLAQVTARMRGV